MLFRDKQGRMGLITEQCPHRRASLAYGIPTNDGIRCPYHGWEFGHQGQCLEPAERAGEELVPQQGQDAGLCGRGNGRRVLGLSGPRGIQAAAAAHRRLRRRRHDPHAGPRARAVQLAPDHGELARPGPHRMAARPHLRVHQGAEGPEPEGRDQRAPREDRVPRIRARHHQASAARPASRRIATTGRSATRSCSRTSCRSATATRNRLALLRVPDPRAGGRHAHACTSGTPPTCRRRARRCRRTCSTRSTPTTCRSRTRTANTSSTTSTPRTSWRGSRKAPIADRTAENLGASDNGIALYRRVLRREIKKVEEGKDPMFTFRDPAQNVRIDLPNEAQQAPQQRRLAELDHAHPRRAFADRRRRDRRCTRAQARAEAAAGGRLSVSA